MLERGQLGMGIVGFCMASPFAIILGGGGHYLIYKGGISFKMPQSRVLYHF